MRALAYSLREAITSIIRAIDVEGFLILGGIAGIAWLAWDLELEVLPGLPLGPTIVFVTMIVIGVAFARSPRQHPPGA